MPGEWPKSQLVTVTLKENDGETDFTLTHADMPVEVYDDCIDGWQQCFDKLESNLK